MAASLAARRLVGLLVVLACILILPEGASWHSAAALLGIAIAVGYRFLEGASVCAKLAVSCLIVSFVALCLWIGAALMLDISLASVVDYRGDTLDVVPRAPMITVVGLAAAATSYLFHFFGRKSESIDIENDRP